MRHGEAQSHAPSDIERNLTDFGMNEVRASVRSLLTYEPEIDLMLVSPYSRARQTADLVSELLGGKPMRVTDAVTPDVSVAHALAEIERQFEGPQIECIMVIMHQPIIGSLVYYLTGVQQPMRTAAVAMIEAPVWERDCCILECVI